MENGKNNVSFISGLGLILSALALLLIGIMQISSRPYDEAMEEIIEVKLKDLESRVDMKIQSGLNQFKRAEDNAAIRELKVFHGNLEGWLATGANGHMDEVQTLRSQVEALIEKIQGKEEPKEETKVETKVDTKVETKEAAPEKTS